MPMTANDRKAELVRRGITMTRIAKELGVTVQHVSSVVGGRNRSPRVERAVAEAIGRPTERVFPSAAA